MNISELFISIANKVKVVKSTITTIYDLIKSKGGKMPKDLTIGNLLDTINSLPNAEIEPNEINFCDFNGMVCSMTIEEVMQLTELPKPRYYHNLTFEHWSMTLEEIQDGRCHTIGAYYHTTDGCNYYIVEVQEGDVVDLQPRDTQGVIYWGDGTSEKTLYSNSHTYQEAGEYTIKWENPSNISGIYQEYTQEVLKEVYYSSMLTKFLGNDFRYAKKLEKLCIPDNAIKQSLNGFFFANANKLKSLIFPNSIGCSLSWSYANVRLDNLQCLVADGWSDLCLRTMNELLCFSCRNVIKADSETKQYTYGKLKYVVFDKVETISNNLFYRGGGLTTETSYNSLKIVDLPETLQSIGNGAFEMNVKTVYLRTLTPPTLGGTSVFWRDNWGAITTIHIRKDATYTDAEGNTFYGLDAYANATNWAKLYASTNFIFIDDL
jgi:hypothetical protein